MAVAIAPNTSSAIKMKSKRNIGLTVIRAGRKIWRCRLHILRLLGKFLNRSHSLVWSVFLKGPNTIKFALGNNAELVRR